MNKSIKKCAQCAVFSSLCFIGLLAFMVLASDEDPMNPMSFSRWLLIKAIAVVVFAMCVWGGKRLYKKGYLPEYIDEIAKDD